MNASCFLIARVCGALLVGLVGGCSRQGVTVLGQPPGEVPVDLATARLSPGATSVTVSGTMIEKCPEAGCWFVLQDGSGKARVDTKTAGFVVVEVPLNRVLTVSGSWVTNGTEVILAATGIRY